MHIVGVLSMVFTFYPLYDKFYKHVFDNLLMRDYERVFYLEDYMKKTKNKLVKKIAIVL